MRKSITSLSILLLSNIALAVTFIPLRGDVAVTTSKDRLKSAVTVSTGGHVMAHFCLLFSQPLEQAINLETKGEVVYLPQPMEGLPQGKQASGAEPIAQTLTVIPENGHPIAFVAKGIKPIVPDSQVVLIKSVVRREPTEAASASGVTALKECD